MHWVQTLAVLFVPFAVVILSVCKFGLNCRREMPVIFVPTPPRYFALPRVVTLLPMTGFLPQISHCADMQFPTAAKLPNKDKTLIVLLRCCVARLR